MKLLNETSKKQYEINKLFVEEEKLTNEINYITMKIKYLDISLIKYLITKEKLKNNIINKKNTITKIEEKKKIWQMNNKEDKLIYLKAQYENLSKVNLKDKVNYIKELKSIINIIGNILKEKDIINEINSNFKNISTITKQNYIKIPNNLSKEEEIIWYENQIKNIIKNKMLLEKYIFSLELLYKQIVEKKLDVTRI